MRELPAHRAQEIVDYALEVVGGKTPVVLLHYELQKMNAQELTLLNACLARYTEFPLPPSHRLGLSGADESED